jgi:hypothetical protein
MRARRSALCRSDGGRVSTSSLVDILASGPFDSVGDRSRPTLSNAPVLYHTALVAVPYAYGKPLQPYRAAVKREASSSTRRPVIPAVSSLSLSSGVPAIPLGASALKAACSRSSIGGMS